jgi:LacI family transcriptional regulator
MASSRSITKSSSPRRPSVFDVAREAGVSHTTVGLVLNGRAGSRVAEPTRKRVNDAVERLSYRPNRMARTLAHGRSYTVGLTLPWSGSVFHGQIVVGAQQELRENGYRLLVVHTDLQGVGEGEVVEFLLEHQVDAMICFRPHAAEAMPLWLDTLTSRRTPAVMVDDATFAEYMDCVVSDDISGMEQAIDHLVALGHERILLYETCWQTTPSGDRPLGYENALSKHGLSYRCRIDATNMTSGELTDSINDRVRSANPPTAIICVNDWMFEDFLVNDHSPNRVPSEVSIVGYGNTELARLARMTSVDQSPLEMGREAGRLLLNRLDNPDRPFQIKTCPTSLIVRSSTAQAN